MAAGKDAAPADTMAGRSKQLGKAAAGCAGSTCAGE